MADDVENLVILILTIPLFLYANYVLAEVTHDSVRQRRAEKEDRDKKPRASGTGQLTVPPTGASFGSWASPVLRINCNGAPVPGEPGREGRITGVPGGVGP